MKAVENLKEYTLDLLLEEANRMIKKEKQRAYVNVLICYPSVFDKIQSIIDSYNKSRRIWNVGITNCKEKDLYLISFHSILTGAKPVFFFWKVINRDDYYVTILSFCLGSHRDIRTRLDSLVNYIRGLWFAWLGSYFLEHFDEFVKKILGEDAEVLVSTRTISRKGPILKKAQEYLVPQQKYLHLSELVKIARGEYRREGAITTFSTVRYSIKSETRGIDFKFSLTDHAQIMFVKGDFTLFVLLLKPLVSEIRRILEHLRKRIYVTKQDAEIQGKRVTIKTFGQIETLTFRRPNASQNWYSKVLSLFTADMRKYKLIVFPLLGGNPYFLAHVVDVENRSAIYLSATNDDIRIAPAGLYASEKTMSKMIDILHDNLDPNLSYEAKF